MDCTNQKQGQGRGLYQPMPLLYIETKSSSRNYAIKIHIFLLDEEIETKYYPALITQSEKRSCYIIFLLDQINIKYIQIE